MRFKRQGHWCLFTPGLREISHTQFALCWDYVEFGPVGFVENLVHALLSHRKLIYTRTILGIEALEIDRHALAYGPRPK